MIPTIQPHDVVLIDQNIARRRRPTGGHIYLINNQPLRQHPGSGLRRADLAQRTLVLSSDHPDKMIYPTRTFDIKAALLPEVLLREVVWVGRSLRDMP